jgi:2-succinyl-5-enolpyruvyl-6-hydroxy-3-cyclohexene-1-carboxylate synthase
MRRSVATPGVSLAVTFDTVRLYRRNGMHGSHLAELQATFCAVLVDQWIADGIEHSVVAPGSRSTPLLLALATRAEVGDLALHIVHDERVAAFVALGIAAQSDRPVVLACTSGTAAAHFLPAIVEAALSRVPLIVATADRPARLRGVGAAQTIDQVDLYGRHVSWAADVVVEHEDQPAWRDLARSAARAAVGPGPAHLNLQFDEPLVGTPRPLEPASVVAGDPSGAAAGGPTNAPPVDPVRPEWFGRSHGVIVAGGCAGVAPDAVVSLGTSLGWPILADPLSGVRPLAAGRAEGTVPIVTAFDSILRVEGFAAAHRPDVVVRIGRPVTSKVTTQWIDASVAAGAVLVQVGGPCRIDPGLNVTAACGIEQVRAAVDGVDRARHSQWSDSWAVADRAADRAVRGAITGADELSEPAVARLVADHLPASAVLQVSSSMPVRDLEWFGGPRARAESNRGANGIDGVLSTAVGRALTGVPVVVLIGDIAYVHDANAMVALRHRRVDVRIVVVDNDGGGIFSFLPQATALPAATFESLFSTPHGTDVIALAEAHGIAATSVDAASELAAQIERPGPWVARVRTNRRRNVEVHQELHRLAGRAVADAVTAGRSR